MPRNFAGYLCFGLAYVFIAFLALSAWPGASHVANVAVNAGATIGGPASQVTLRARESR